jgi:4-hydroxy-4-methyl-2-oxoglutarate aldolase
MNREPSDDPIVIDLQRLDVCAVSDALDRLGLPSATGALHHLSVRRRICGPVSTVRLVAASDAPHDAPARHLGTAAITAAPPGTVIVVEQRTGIEASGWGGILSRAAVRAGVSAVICDGWVRDVDEALELDFPILARSVTPRTARGRLVEASTNEPVIICDTTVRAGDYVIADSTGVAFIAGDRAREVIDIALSIAAREAAIVQAVESGVPVTEAMGANYDTMLKST